MLSHWLINNVNTSPFSSFQDKNCLYDWHTQNYLIVTQNYLIVILEQTPVKEYGIFT